MARDLGKLKVYELADALAVEAYGLTTRVPAEERFGLGLQLRQAAAGAPLRIVEACGQGDLPAFLEKLRAAQLEAEKARYLLGLARRLGPLSGPACAITESRCLHLIRSLQRLMKAERTRMEARQARSALQRAAS